MNDHAMQVAWESLRSTGGFSIDPKTGAMPEQTGFMVSLKGHEETYPEYMFWMGKDAFIAAYVQRHRAALLLTRAFLGAWINDGKVFLDVSQQYDCEVCARQAGAEHGQLAIYDLRNKKEIML